MKSEEYFQFTGRASVLTPEQISAAVWYLVKHMAYVTSLTHSTELSYPPSLNEDKNRPELWKAAHWRWFLEL